MKLTRRQAELLQLLIHGLENHDCAYSMGVTDSTVEQHRKALMSRTRCKTAVQLGAWAVLNGYWNIKRPAVGKQVMRSHIHRGDAL
jgi:DNA-binding NarL/FixJ family response regulator